MKTRGTLAAATTLALALAGCASADKTTTSAAAAGKSNSGMSCAMPGMSMPGCPANSPSGAGSHNSSASVSGAGGSGSALGSNGSGMPGMKMGANGQGTATIVNAKGVPTPVPVKTIASGDWQDMKIQAQETTPVPFYIYNGNSYREDKPAKGTSFHLMVMLSDRHTGEPIPYATVWATITKNGKSVYNDTQWPMNSEYMGPHYGNNVKLPGPGTYKLTLLVSGPKQAMHVEYAHMWKGSHKLTSTFTWK